ncbi:GCN5-related N-acetyltransferase [Cyanobacterium stanieri PCC 7202]|uniref:GCN5-related N-acetyltransferase n=1 Tax=Cyanobacterium stanieri (strain ATCC 29140 / PCC 7202) TaxID=292563 RepID=K9YNG9_CYASC|nr:GCN5-related N-acetyltransferase [Cyanobacterium stanieri PCC 7202]
MTWSFCEVTNPSLNRSLFDCGICELNDYLQRYAKQNHKKGIAKTWVIVNINFPEIPLGYYSLSMAEVKRDSLSDEMKKGLPRYPLPVIKIAKLAVDQDSQGQGLGELLLVDVFQRSLKISKDIGVIGFLVDAINEKAKEFYLKYGFTSLIDSPLSLFLPMGSISSLF